MATATGSDGLNHHALFYRDQREYLTSVRDFTLAGIAGGEPVFIVVPGDKNRILREWLGDVPGQLTYADMAETGRNPARIIPEVNAFVDQNAGRPVRFIEEPAWPGRSAAELREVTRHEALVNLALAGTAARVLCLFDAAGLANSVIGGARRTHPAILNGGHPETSASYSGTDTIPAECDRPLPAPPARAETISYRTDLRPMRRLVETHSRRCGLSADRVGSLVLAAGELAANTLRHTSAGGTMHIWHTRLEILCQVRDQGWITDPLAGRRRRLAAEPGHGLWLVNQVCDLVELRTTQAGTTIRLHMSRPPVPSPFVV